VFYGGGGRAAGEEGEYHDLAAYVLDYGLFDEVAAGVVSALDVQVWFDVLDQGFRRILVEDDYVVHAGERSQQLGPVLFERHRASRAFYPARGAVGVQADD